MENQPVKTVTEKRVGWWEEIEALQKKIWVNGECI